MFMKYQKYRLKESGDSQTIHSYVDTRMLENRLLPCEDQQPLIVLFLNALYNIENLTVGMKM